MGVFDYARCVRPNAFGNALGGSLVDAMQSKNSAQQSFRASEIQAQNSDAALLAAQESMSAAQSGFRRGEIAYQNASNGGGFVDAQRFDDGASLAKQQGRQRWQAVFANIRGQIPIISLLLHKGLPQPIRSRSEKWPCSN
jgi:hypothetical protein